MKDKINNGITLISLAVTIIVMLIIAGTSINLIFGENSLIKQAKKSKEENRGGSVEEYCNLWKSNVRTDIEMGYSTAQTLEELLEYLKEKGLLYDNEIEQIQNDGNIIIGSHNINFSLSDDEELKPGLYQSGTTQLIKSWKKLIDDGDITVNGKKLTKISYSLDGDLIISNQINELSKYGELKTSAMNGTPKLKSVNIPSTIKEIPTSAFGCFQNLNKIILNNGLETISDSAFIYCKGLTEIIIPNSVFKIGSNAFKNCSNLATIDIPESLTSIYGNSFIGTKWYKSQSNNKNIYIGKIYYTYKGNLSQGKRIEIKDGTKVIANNAFESNNWNLIVLMPNSIEKIGIGFFNEISTLNYKGSQDDWSRIMIDDPIYPSNRVIINYNYNI